MLGIIVAAEKIDYDFVVYTTSHHAESINVQGGVLV